MGITYTDKVVIITGGTKGIGRGCVDEFVKAGSKVVFCSRKEDEGAAVVREVESMAKKSGGEVTFVRCDMRTTEDIQHLINATIEKYNRIDCLINNAGWHPEHKPMDEFTVEEFLDILNLNVVSIFSACKYALPHLRKSEGNIINLSSLVGHMGQLYGTTYVATKGAVTALSKALAIDEAQYSVRVNSVSPGNIYTPLWQEAIDAAPDPAKCRADGDAAQLMGRMGTTEEAAKLCLFIAAEATFTTGVDHIISGGAELGYGRKSRVS